MVICSCPDANTREVLKLVCDLYALDRIWKDIGTYRNVDYVAPNKAKASFIDHSFIIQYNSYRLACRGIFLCVPFTLSGN